MLTARFMLFCYLIKYNVSTKKVIGNNAMFFIRNVKV